MDNYKEKIHSELIKEVKRRLFDESVPRLKKCLSQLNEEEIWHRPNEQTVSVGNLVLHLCGNVTQWILCGLGNEADKRVRHEEFDEKGPIPVEKLTENIDDIMARVDNLLDHLDPDILLEKRKTQGFEETGLSILIHVVEHFSYHIGQITYIVKSGKNVDLKYYEDIDLNKIN